MELERMQAMPIWFCMSLSAINLVVLAGLIRDPLLQVFGLH